MHGTNFIHFLWRKVMRQASISDPQKTEPEAWSEERHHEVMLQRQRTGDEVLYRYRHSKQQESLWQASLRAQSTFNNEADSDKNHTAGPADGRFGLNGKVILKEPAAQHVHSHEKLLLLDGTDPVALMEQDSGADEEQCLAESCPSLSGPRAKQTAADSLCPLVSSLPPSPCLETGCGESASAEQLDAQQAALQEISALLIQHGAFLHILPGVRAAFTVSDRSDCASKRSRRRGRKIRRWFGGS
jgi:hypothetical protein